MRRLRPGGGLRGLRRRVRVGLVRRLGGRLRRSLVSSRRRLPGETIASGSRPGRVRRTAASCPSSRTRGVVKFASCNARKTRHSSPDGRGRQPRRRDRRARWPPHVPLVAGRTACHSGEKRRSRSESRDTMGSASTSSTSRATRTSRRRTGSPKESCRSSAEASRFCLTVRRRARIAGRGIACCSSR